MADPANQSTAVAKRELTHVDALSAYLKQREKNLAAYAKNSISTETMIRLACYESGKQSWMKTATPESVYASLIISAQLGLEPSGARGEAYLVPFKGVCSLMPGYRGLIKLALRSGGVKSIRARIAYDGDDFDVHYGSDERIVHRPLIGRELEWDDKKKAAIPPKIIAAYAIAEMTDGSKPFEVMDGWQLDKVRAASAQPNGDAWVKWPDEMYRKAPIRRLAKYIPLGSDYFAKAVRLDEAHDSGKVAEVSASFIDAEYSEVGDESAQPEPSRIQKAAERANGNPVSSSSSSSKSEAPKSKANPWRPVNGGMEATIGERKAVVAKVKGTEDDYSWSVIDGAGEEVDSGMAAGVDAAKTFAEKAAAK